jgi:Icc-related predicted phosphoesterase
MKPVMKILAVSDQEVERLYTLAANGHFRGIQIILGCGDLPYSYLEYLLSVLNAPLFYIPGNHDPKYDSKHPLTYVEGASNLDLKIARFDNMLLAGLGGSIRYRPDGVNQYNQAEAYSRAFHLLSRILLQRLVYRRRLDILISHSPPFGIHDENSGAHQGLKALNFLIRWARPRYHLHGHTHFFRRNLENAVTQVGQTTVMNIFPYKLIEIQHE